MLDCDEELLPESRDELKQCLNSEQALAFAVIRQDLVDETRLDQFSEMWQVRLYRNLPDLKFTGRFHHQPSPPLVETAALQCMEVRESQVRIRHFGYVTSKKAEKNRRVVHLLSLELKDRPGQFYYLVELGVTLLALGDLQGIERLAEAARMLADDDPQMAACRGQCAMLLEFVLAYDKLPPDFPLSRQRARTLALERFPISIPLLWQIASSDYLQGRFAACAVLLERDCLHE